MIENSTCKFGIPWEGRYQLYHLYNFWKVSTPLSLSEV